jgi:DivIVA domain-containing protein
MASMDVTPQELRDIEIREAWRGYHRDDVDELLERAAATIEHLEEENRELKARLAQGAGAPAPAPVPAPVRTPVAPAPAPAPAPVRGADTDVIQRTLVLAQKAADEAVAEARAKAQQMLSESESKAQSLVAEAEASARRIAETERKKLEEEIAQLSASRDTLSADVDALERFEREYRERLRSAIAAELELLGSTGGGATDRPVLHDVHQPTPTPASTSWSASQEAVVPGAPAPGPGSATVHIEAVEAYVEMDAAGPPGAPGALEESAGGSTDAATADVVDDSEEHEIGDDDTGPHDSLDDDAFFASLREAVRDDTPLGTTDEDETGHFEQGQPEEERRLFRRRR